MRLVSHAAVLWVASLATHHVVTAEFLSALHQCPAPCPDQGTADDWTTYNSVSRLKVCNDTMLVDFNIYTPVEAIRACTPKESSSTVLKRMDSPEEFVAATTDSSKCASAVKTQATAQSAWLGELTSAEMRNSAIEAVEQVQSYLGMTSECTSTILFGYSRGAVVGIWSGSKIRTQGLASGAVQQFLDNIKSDGVRATHMLQIEGQNSDYSFGIYVTTNSSVKAAQAAVRTWSDGNVMAVGGFDGFSELTTPLLAEPALTLDITDDGPSNTTANSSLLSRVLHARANCKTAQVVSGDSCGTLAKKCGISAADFTKYNPNSKLCSTLQVGQRVCCSSGSLPDLTPKPYANGTCATYLVKSGDYCAKIASENSLTVDKLETFNKKTWGWTGCNRLQAGIRMCLSTGTPPMPAPITNALCGPQVPGTQPPTGNKQLADLNPCPLNACCDVWGQCGITLEFCLPSQADSGAPGTAQPGKNGCISNCYTAIVNNGETPASQAKVAYFEGWNADRACLHMDVTSVDSSYTHIHFAFATINEASWTVDVSKSQDQFELFKGMKGPKKILSFGGWSFSTDADTYPIFRTGVTSANRQAFANNVVDFMVKNNLDGLDFDWEYPGAPDIPGIPPGSKQDGPNYLEFLKMVRAKMPSGKTLSIAAPASYWYLKGFPIKDMAPVLDYVIYMTYDLHGQWDYGSKWASEGCPEGNCLRSHINLTETQNALAMITKAGVPAKKIFVGVTSYGRSFKMAKAGCTGEMCRYLGPESKAKKGECTSTAGYIANAEIEAIISDGKATSVFRDDSLTNILVYEDTEWVAYMDAANKKQRTTLYKEWKMGGTADWAVDLWQYGTSGGSGTNPNDPSIPWFNMPACTAAYFTLDDIDKNKGNIPDACMNAYIFGALGKMLQTSLAQYQDVLDDGYDHAFKTYSDYVIETSPEALHDFMVNHGDPYFTCVIEEKDGDGWKNKTMDCPPDTDGHPWNVYWIPKDLDKFYKDLTDATGIDPFWVHLTTWRYMPCLPEQEGHCDEFGSFKNYPQMTDFKVNNPKDFINEMKPKLEDTVDSLFEYNALARLWLYDGSSLDIADGSSLMVFMVQASVDAMEGIKKMGDKIDEEKKKNLILLILTAFLMIIPGIGELVIPAELANLARIIAIGGEVANGALDIYQIVQDRSSAPLAVFSILLGGLSLIKAPKAFGDAAAARRAMKAGDLAKLGDTVKNGVQRVSSLAKACKVL